MNLNMGACTFGKLVDREPLLLLHLLLLDVHGVFLLLEDLELDFSHHVGEAFEEKDTAGGDDNLLLEHAGLHGLVELD